VGQFVRKKTTALGRPFTLGGRKGGKIYDKRGKDGAGGRENRNTDKRKKRAGVQRREKSKIEKGGP